MIKYRILKKGNGKYQVQCHYKGIQGWVWGWMDRLLEVETETEAYSIIQAIKMNDNKPQVIYSE